MVVAGCYSECVETMAFVYIMPFSLLKRCRPCEGISSLPLQDRRVNMEAAGSFEMFVPIHQTK
jgi:hypothetical protein